MTLVENFNKPVSVFTKVGSSSDITFQTVKGNLKVTKLTNGWDTGGLVQTDSVVLEEGMEFALNFEPVTNIHINDDNASSYILGLIAGNTALPSTPTLSIQTYGFIVANAKAAAQNASSGNFYGPSMVAGEDYKVIQTVTDDGSIDVEVYGGNNDGILWTVPGDFRGYHARFCMNFYWSDTVILKKFTLR